jgi:hypothetical protein
MSIAVTAKKPRAERASMGRFYILCFAAARASGRPPQWIAGGLWGTGVALERHWGRAVSYGLCYWENWWRERLPHVFGTQRPQCHRPH